MRTLELAAFCMVFKLAILDVVAPCRVEVTRRELARVRAEGVPKVNMVSEVAPRGLIGPVTTT